ncbi:MAG: NUDIX domain-containing protein [Candidatus Aminicenantes bacterium]|nr:NUDIX domain-containing protein [Candidatus Aminicenantes bacterium]
MQHYLCLVDRNGRFLREERKEECHLGEGLLHSAFLVMVFNKKNELMIARRSEHKMLWPGFWDGTVASHYYKGRAPRETIETRILEEIGVSNNHPEFLFKFRYHAKYKNIGSENEICDVFRDSDVQSKNISVNPAEISEYRFLSVHKLQEEINENPKEFAPWFILAFQEFVKNHL